MIKYVKLLPQIQNFASPWFQMKNESNQISYSIMITPTCQIFIFLRLGMCICQTNVKMSGLKKTCVLTLQLMQLLSINHLMLNRHVFVNTNLYFTVTLSFPNKTFIYYYLTEFLFIISVLFDSGSVGFWIAEYYLRIQNNVLTREDRDNMWTSQGMAELGYSFWYF